MDARFTVSAWIPGVAARDHQQAWDEFLDQYAPVILQVVGLFAHGEDQIHDCFVFVCERLERNGLRKLRRFDPQGPASFPTWLRALVRNLCLDWHRKRSGRRRPYRSIARLPELEREIFHAVHLRGLDESEAFHTVEMLYPSLTPARFADCLVRIEKALSWHQSWRLTASATRLVSLSSSPCDSPGHARDRGIAGREYDPEEEAARREYLHALRRALDKLPKQQRLLVQLKFEQELTYEQIAALTHLDGPRAVQGLLHKAVAALRAEITADIAAPLSVKDG